MTLFDLLKTDHRLVKDLMDKIAQENDQQRRQELCATLAQQMKLHNQAEANVVYETLKAVDDAKDLVNHSYEEHQEAETLLERLLSEDIGEEEWMATFDKAKQGILHHIQTEETETFEMLQDTFKEDELEAIAKNFEAEKAALDEAKA